MTRVGKISLWFGSLDLLYKIALAVVILAALGAGGYGVYRWYRLTVEVAAQQSFSETMQTYREAFSAWVAPDKSKHDMNLWEEVEVAAKVGYEQNARSSLAPFFLAYQADALVYQGKYDEALDVLNKAISLLPSWSPFNSLYQLKRSLMRIDQDHMHDQGVKELEQLAQDTSNSFQDAALFYLGSYYLAQNNVDKAHEILQQLITQFSTKQEPDEARSVWAMQAKMLLNQK